MPDIFLSYNREDQEVARRFAEGFERAGLSVWWDVTLNPGEAYDEVTEKALIGAKAVVVLWSTKSVVSRWVRAEATQAARNKTLLPVMIEPCTRPIMFELTQTSDLSGWKGDTNDAAWLALIASVRRFIDKGAPVDTAQPTPRPTPRTRGGRRIGMAAVAVAALLLIAGGTYWTMNRGGGAQGTARAVVPAGSVPETAAAFTQAADEKSLAILPFSNLSSDPEQDYFADGLTEELINTMAGVDGLLVTGRTSSFYFKNTSQPLDEIASTLGVANILQGSVRKSGTALRITVQLTEIDTGFTLWSQTFDRQLDDIFVIEEEIARDVGTALSVTLGAGDFAKPGMTRNVDAYVEYMQAKDKVAESTGESVLEAIVHAETAVSLDPDFAHGWLTLAHAYGAARAFASGDQTVGFEQKQTAATARAASLVPDLRENKIVAYSELKEAGKYAEAEQLLVQLGNVYGQDANLNREYGTFLLEVGRVQESKVALERARRQDPLSAEISAYLALSMRSANVPADTIRAEINRGLSLGGFEPVLYANLSMLEVKEKNWPAATAAMEHMNTRQVYLQLTTYIREERTQEGLAYLRGLLNDPNVVPILRARSLPLFAALYGDPQLALELLRPRKEPILLQEIWHAHFSAMRKLPEFKAWMQEKGLVDYWRTTGKWADACPPAGDDFVCE